MTNERMGDEEFRSWEEDAEDHGLVLLWDEARRARASELAERARAEKAEAEAAAMREALERNDSGHSCPNGDDETTAEECWGCRRRAALSSDAGKRILEELERLESQCQKAQADWERAHGRNNEFLRLKEEAEADRDQLRKERGEAREANKQFLADSVNRNWEMMRGDLRRIREERDRSNAISAGLRAERDQLRAELEKAKAERDEAKAELKRAGELLSILRSQPLVMR